MDLLRDTIMIIGIPREYHNTLSKWAAERSLRKPDKKTTPEIIVDKAICEYIDRIERMEANLKSTDENAESIPEFDVI